MHVPLARTPPVREGVSSSTWDIHNHIALSEELRRCKWLSKEICEIVGRAHKWYRNGMRLHCLTDEEMSPFNVFHARVMLRIVTDILSSLVSVAKDTGGPEPCSDSSSTNRER